jgi:chemotaxis protein MotB
MAKHVCKKGAPMWMLTFADMMSLLLTFFVLLLSMSEIDATRFRKVSGSLKMAFGVQRVSVFDDPPKGSSFIKEEHSAGGESRAPMSIGGSTANIIDPQLQGIKNVMKKNQQIAALEAQKRLEQNIKKVYDRFNTEFKEGKVEIVKDGTNLVLRISENAIFPDQYTQIKGEFSSILDKLSDVAVDVSGDIIISGHSDDKIIKTGKYKSNWEFSAARANTLAQALMKKGDIDPERITVQFHGPTKPLVKNNSEINRRKNRRIEIIIKH